jgi:hypothetical protein
MNDEIRANPVNTEVVSQALTWVHLKNNPEMFYETYDGRMPDECESAIKVLTNNYAEFEKWLQDQLSTFPLIKSFFGDFVETRLKQKEGILDFPILDWVCDDSKSLEHRLERIQSISGIAELKRECYSSSNPIETDRAILDLSTEVLILDFMLQMGFTGIRKVPKQDKAHIDIIGVRDGKTYAIEVTRKKEVEGWQTIPYGNLEDPDNPHNQEKISNVLWNTLLYKNGQFSAALKAGTIEPAMIKVVAIKTSDFGFAWCIEQTQRIAGELLMQTDELTCVDCIWLVPNIEVTESRWVCKSGCGVGVSSNSHHTGDCLAWLFP